MRPGIVQIPKSDKDTITTTTKSHKTIDHPWMTTEVEVFNKIFTYQVMAPEDTS